MNAYSDTWFELFMDTIDPAQTAREVEFLERQLPPSTFTRVLDVCCGTCRHAARLAERGYDVLGIDVNDRALAGAPSAVNVLAHDMRETKQLPGRYDAVLLLWQSFGQFDDATNTDVLGQIAHKLVPGGRFVLDIYHRGFFEPRLATRVHEKLGRTITERKRMSGQRLVVELEYGDGSGDRFEWHVFMPEEIVELARSVGLFALLQCADFDESLPPSAARPRMQLVFEKR